MEQEKNQNHSFSQFTDRGLDKNASYDAIEGSGNYDNTTAQQFGALQEGYNFFKSLFPKKLSPVILTLSRKVKSMGYYKPFGWVSVKEDVIPEININPAIPHLPAKDVMQTLVHEMCHHYQHLYGTPGKRGYHNKEFSRMMFSVRLMCSHTGMPGGKVTGRAMADYAVCGGAFELKFQEMPSEFLLPFKPFEKGVLQQSIETNERLADKNKHKYSCPKCKANAWGKPGLKLLCIVCNKQLL